MPHVSAAAHPSPSVRFHLKALAPLMPLMVLALTAPVHASNAAEPWDAPAFSADPATVVRAATALPASPETGDPGVDVLLMESVYSYDDAGKETYTHRLVYRFQEGKVHESWSAIEESWAPWHQERPTLRARVITPDGVAHRLDPATVTENAGKASGPDMFEDGRVLRAPLPATGPGSVVEQEVVVRESAPFFQAGTVRYANLQLSVPVRHVRLVLEAPAGLPLRWMARKLPGASPREEVSAGRRRLTFEVRGLAPWEAAEPGLPPEVARTAYVAFSTGRSWSDLARRYSEIVDQAIRGSDVAAFLRSAGSQSGSQVETIDKLLSKLGREIRYTGIELGQGSLLPRPPAETLKRRFGDCKDKAVLLTALLRSLDIPAYVALLNAGEGDPDVEESLPGLGAFNHAIVMVPGNPAVWIDPTEPFARAGELPVQDQGRLALVASPTATGLVRTPASTSADNREVETRELFLSDLGGARVVETTEYWGVQEQELRSSYAGADREGVREALWEYASEAYLAKSLSGLDFSDPSDLSRPFRLRLELADADRGTTDVREAAVAIFLSPFAERLGEELAGSEESGEDGPRVHDFVFTRPFQLEVRYRIVPPAGFAPRPLPTAPTAPTGYRARQFGPARLEEAYTEGKDGVVEATLRFDTGKRRISPAELEALRKGVRELSQEKPVMISFEQVGEAHLAAGRIREALTEFRKLAAGDPKKALPRTRIARALLAGGLGEAARQEAEEATRLEPGFAHAWTTLGWIRQHDDMGRRFGKSFDRAGAIQAYRKAVEVAPSNDEARGDLAILLEHDAEGNRYAPGADLAAAIAEYEAMKTGFSDLGLGNNLAIANMWAERFEGMKKALEGKEASESVSALRLVAVAATSGAEAAVKEAERAHSDGESRASVLSAAGRNLMLLRRYTEAAALFEQAGKQSSNAAALLGLAELLRKTRRHEELALAARDPAGAVRRLMSLAALPPAAGQLDGLLSQEMTRDLSPGERQAFWAGFRQGFDSSLRAAKAADMPVAVAMDIGLAALRDSVTGDDALGYRVVMSATVGEGMRRTVFVVREDGEYRIAATDRTLYMVGGEVLRRLEKKDLRGARQWLDWAYDELAGLKGPDPMAASPLLSLWPRGSEGDAEQIRCAGASLLGWTEQLGKLVPVLASCRDAAPQGPRRDALELALLSAYQAMNRSAEAAETARRLQEAAPTSKHLFLQQLVALRRLGRWDDARQAAERLVRASGDPAAQQTLAEIAMRKGDFPAAEAMLQRLIDSGKADPGVFNELAWLLVFQGKADERALALAQQAAELTQYKVYSVLHTLASIYAEQGRTAEAYRLALQAMEAEGGEPGAPDWYIFGRLAEQYGLADAARRCYERARWTGEGEPEPMSSIHLARRRLEALGSRPAEPKRTASRP